jgi:hypothetical protein
MKKLTVAVAFVATMFAAQNANGQNKTQTCPDCLGKGTIKCFYCLGKGELRKSCNKCNGHGTISEVCGSEIIGTENCSKCNGSGWYDSNVSSYKCPNCNGSGYRENRHGDRVKCWCNNGYLNTKREECYKCHKKGIVNIERTKYCDRKCNVCYGDGFSIIACNNCNQTGLNPCTKCDSTGKINSN